MHNCTKYPYLHEIMICQIRQRLNFIIVIYFLDEFRGFLFYKDHNAFCKTPLTVKFISRALIGFYIHMKDLQHHKTL